MHAHSASNRCVGDGNACVEDSRFVGDNGEWIKNDRVSTGSNGSKGSIAMGARVIAVGE